MSRSLDRRDFLQSIQAAGAGLASASLAASLPATGPAIALANSPLTAADAKPKKVLFFTKSSGFEHGSIRRRGDELSHAEKTLIALGKKHGFAVTASKDGRLFDGDHEQFDAYVFYTTGDLTKVGRDKAPGMSKKGKQNLLDAVSAGKGFVGSHCASDTFHGPGNRFETQRDPDPYIAMLGGEFIRHGPQQKAKMTLVDPKFPGMDVVKDGSFTMHEEWYSLKNFAADMHVLLVTETEGMKGKDYQRPSYPGTWARRHGKGRVFYTSMGHREDVWTSPIFQSIFVGGIHWALGNVDADVPANIKEVTPQSHVMPPR